jgi:hypothetical protein
MTQFDHLTRVFAEFASKNQPVLTDSRISPYHKALREDYLSFLRQATIHLSCVAPDHDLRGSMKSSQLYRSARSLLYNWAGFIESANELENDGIRPYVNGINSNFNAVFDCIATVRSLLPVIRFRTDIACVALQNFQDDMLQLRTEITRIIVSPKAQRFQGFLHVAFKRRIVLMMHQISSLFNKSLLHSCVSITRLATARALISSSIAAIAMDVEMAHQFDESFNLLRQEICLLNDKLTRLFDLLKIPFEVSLVFQDEAKAESHPNSHT